VSKDVVKNSGDKCDDRNEGSNTQECAKYHQAAIDELIPERELLFVFLFDVFAHRLFSE
jgi:hypothetical protein